MSKTAEKILIAGILIIMSGCAPLHLTVDKREMSVDDVISLSKIDLDSDIIILQLESTYSKFRLDTQEILRLKTAGVDDEIIKYMIETTSDPGRFSWEYRDSPTNESFYGFNGSGLYYDNTYTHQRGQFGTVPYVSPYTYPVNIQTDLFRQINQDNGRSLLYDSQLFQHDSREQRSRTK
jgi:hypothetical protein